MGTNYYLHSDICPHCGRGDDEIHIGKSSAGWCFSLHVYPDNGINSLDDWKAKFDTPNSKIFNEYGDKVDVVDMLRNITERTWDRAQEDDGWYALNHAQRGPNNLSRHAIDGRHCIGHGDGTYDFVVGDFS